MSARSDRPVVVLSWSLTLDCPKCDEWIDVADLDQENTVARKIFNNQWDKVAGEEITCPHCGHEFEIGEVIY